MGNEEISKVLNRHYPIVKTLEWLQKNETTKNPLEPYDKIN